MCSRHKIAFEYEWLVKNNWNFNETFLWKIKLFVNFFSTEASGDLLSILQNIVRYDPFAISFTCSNVFLHFF